MNRIVLLAIAFVWSVPFSSEIAAAEPPPTQQPPTPQVAADLKRDLAGYWPLAGDARDHSAHDQHATIRGPVDLTAAGPDDRPATAAAFNGRDAFLEIPASQDIAVASGDFSISTWVLCDDTGDDVPGDLLSQYDPARRRGFHLTLKTSAGVTTNQANYRHLQFGIDNDRPAPWTDCGRPGSTILAFALAAHDGSLYAGTCEPGAKDSGRVYRYGGEQKWIDCGSPTPANSITALAVHDGALYAASGQYRLGGSALEESKNANTGGRVYRFAGGTEWVDCGQLPGVEAIGGLAVFRGRLYASSLYRPAGFFRYDGGTKWTDCGTPGKRVEALGVYNGFLYATSYDEGHVFRYDGTSWTDCGQLGEAQANTQTYSFAVHAGRLFVGTWRTGRVYRFEDVNRWTDAGRLGEELEVMGMLVHNGRLIAGTLPLAEVYQYAGGTDWRQMARLDHTPDVTYRRAWTMAELGSRVFVSTLPSGHVYSYQAGQTASWNTSFPSGWRHLAAVKHKGHLRLYVDGRQVGESESFDAAGYDLTSDAPLRIGLGSSDYFAGRLSQVRLYRRALNPAEVGQLAETK
jgi:hypothetical protein